MSDTHSVGGVISSDGGGKRVGGSFKLWTCSPFTSDGCMSIDCIASFHSLHDFINDFIFFWYLIKSQMIPIQMHTN